MIIVTYQVKKTVDNDAIELSGKINTVKGSVFPHGVNGDKQISGQSRTLAIIKGNDISVIIVSQIFNVDIQQIFIGTKYNANVANLAVFRDGNIFKPSGC